MCKAWEVLELFETSKLRGRIVEKFGTMKAFSKAVHNSESFISQYMRGKKILDQRMIDSWAEALDIPATEYDVYFFTKKIHET